MSATGKSNGYVMQVMWTSCINNLRSLTSFIQNMVRRMSLLITVIAGTERRLIISMSTVFAAVYRWNGPMLRE